MSEMLSLIEASERLGVHYMTAYRYVRTGRLPAEKQKGQWCVLLEDLAAFADPDKAPPNRQEAVPRQLVERLLAGDENGAFQLLEDSMASGAEAEEVYLDFISPALADIGQRWFDGEITVADEHVASSILLRIIGRLGSRTASRGRTKGTILLAVVSNDHHGMPSALLRDVLRSRGYNAIDLGPDTPPESILERARDTNDLVAIGLCATIPGNDDIVSVTLSVLSEGIEAPIVVGGGAFTGADHIESLGDCIGSTSNRDAIKIFDNIHRARTVR